MGFEIAILSGVLTLSKGIIFFLGKNEHHQAQGGTAFTDELDELGIVEDGAPRIFIPAVADDLEQLALLLPAGRIVSSLATIASLGLGGRICINMARAPMLLLPPMATALMSWWWQAGGGGDGDRLVAAVQGRERVV